MTMLYFDFLGQLHEVLAPRTYLEIGIRYGHSLAQSRCLSIGIDPQFQVQQEVTGPASLIRATSDEYFDRLAGAGSTPFGPLPIDLAFVDGMHLFEYALRDFTNVEKYCASSSVIVFDDIYPGTIDEAARNRPPGLWSWSGDVFRLPIALRALRPDLRVLMVDTDPCGLMVAVRADPTNRVLVDAFDEIVAEYTMADPQQVPSEVIRREGALSAEEALELPLWTELRRLRETGGREENTPSAASSRRRRPVREWLRRSRHEREDSVSVGTTD
jgi:hypothetical protein